MAVFSGSVERLISADFGAFVSYAFRMKHGEMLGDQPYVKAMVYIISGMINRKLRRLLINLPPQHLKSFVGSICLAAFLLGKYPRLRIILLGYNDTFAEALCRKIRDLMQTAWYQRAFETRIKEGHSRANDFETTEGGGVYAAGATGAITGRSADFLIYDDPHEIGDWNNDRKLDLVWANFNTILSRLHDKIHGQAIVVAHRLSENDLSSHLLAEKGWTYLRLPLVAVKTRTYKLGHQEWVREKGNVLRPAAYPSSEIARLRRTQLAPPFELFYQQGLASQGSLKIRPEHFQSFAQFELPIGPVVLSIDPGQGSGPNASRSVIQAWKRKGKQHYLIDEFCEQCDLDELKDAFWFFARRHRPSVALIENTANGPGLYSAVRRKAKFDLKRITPRQESKAARLGDHRRKIRAKKIFLPELAIWREAFIEELVAFPGEFDDRVDALTMYLDFMDTNPTIPVPRARALGVLVPATPLSQLRYRRIS
ncbi:MAG: phage terminase large subunit [Bradyrhizobium sp.]|jgi:predicted phage terminase large subunit-like protein